MAFNQNAVNKAHFCQQTESLTALSVFVMFQSALSQPWWKGDMPCNSMKMPYSKVQVKEQGDIDKSVDICKNMM